MAELKELHVLNKHYLDMPKSNKYKWMLQKGNGGNPMRGIIKMQSNVYKEGRDDTLAEVKEIIDDCPGCSHEQMILVLRKLNSLK